MYNLILLALYLPILLLCYRNLGVFMLFLYDKCMKIMIVGFSGSGKSTLAKKLADIYNVPILYLDTVQFLEGWKDRDNDEALEIIKNFLDTNDNWIIDGNYFKRWATRRANEADKIIFMNFGRLVCLRQAFKRAKEYKNKTRESMTIGCNERMNLSFIHWILFGGRTRYRLNKYKNLKETYPNKFIEIKNHKELEEFLSTQKAI